MLKRIRIIIRGAVQGVGFRPFVYRLAQELRVNGWVLNSSQGVFIEAEGEKEILVKLLDRIRKEKPPRSYIQSLEHSYLDIIGYDKFEIRFSEESGDKTVIILPDIAVCDECLNEIFDSSNRRYLYPFTNCTNCGPRFTIIEKLPYDRPNTSMKIFRMCEECKKEYENPLDRRFHAQPNACPKCGPQLQLWNKSGNIIEENHSALVRTSELIKEGKITAVKGLGGFHLIADAGNSDAVAELRLRKHREEKPFALMYPDLKRIEEDCEVSESEIHLLLSPESPIVLLKKRKDKLKIADETAPGNPCLGVMLSYTPLHHILMRELGIPVVATSGNISDEPICIDEYEALNRLKDIADIFLIHNRPIIRHADDSIVRIISGREFILRRARGYAPLPVTLKQEMKNTLALGAHLKNTVSISVDKNIFISQHIGDLETKEAYMSFIKVADDFQKLYDIKPDIIACDLHPDYLSTQYAKSISSAPFYIQHHLAHIFSCMAENEIEDDVLGVSWDGTGFGNDGTIWGGEFFLVKNSSCKRFAYLRQFRLPGGEMAIREVWRCALGLLYELYKGDATKFNNLPLFKEISEREIKILIRMLETRTNSPLTSSAGRLFDAVSSLIGVTNRANFEGQAAMKLEFMIEKNPQDEFDKRNVYTWNLKKHNEGETEYIIDWEPMINEIMLDISEVNMELIALKFHNTLAEMITEVSKRSGLKKIVLSGGCFQNKYLLEKTIKLLEENDFQVYWHQRVPTNDGGISLGQTFAVSKILNK